MRTVYAETSIETDPGRVLPAFLEQPYLQGWWGVARSLVEPRPGGLWTLTWQISDTGIRYISTGIIEQIIPHEYLKIGRFAYLAFDRDILGPMELEVHVSRTDETHAKVRVVQSGYQYGGHWDWYYDAVVQAWPIALNLLKEFLEKKES